ncbi:MAG: hypothetical protein D6732_15925 [Methanobacteriota archaeon]|nr:MAG: hypothetical protein D6732_15925 [Euryarchaeota archaeon]
MIGRNHLLPVSEFVAERKECKEIVQGLFGLNQLEFEVFCSLNLLRRADIQTIMNHVGRKDRTRVNRSLNRLLELDLITRKKERSDEGTLRYYYYPIDLQTLQSRLEHLLENWYAHAIEEIRSIPNHFIELERNSTK